MYKKYHWTKYRWDIAKMLIDLAELICDLIQVFCSNTWVLLLLMPYNGSRGLTTALEKNRGIDTSIQPALVTIPDLIPEWTRGTCIVGLCWKNGLKVVTVWFYGFDGSSISKQICHVHTHIFLWFLSFSYIILVVIPQARYPEPVCNLIKEKRVGTYLWGHSSAWSPTNVADWNKEIPLAISLS